MRSKTVIVSIHCPNCRCDLWETYLGDRVICANCSYSRPFTSRKPKPHTITPSQQKAIDRVKQYFKENWNHGEELHKVEINTTDYGSVWLTVHTRDHVLTDQGGLFSIGPRGKITMHSVYDLGGSDGHAKEMARHYCKMLKAHYKV